MTDTAPKAVLSLYYPAGIVAEAGLAVNVGGGGRRLKQAGPGVVT
jgi:hypothetical protein